MLEYLKLQKVGPAPEMEMELGPRLNVITGDNGLGKTVLLDAAWLVLAWTWPQAWPGKGIVPAEEGAEVTWQERREALMPRASLRYDFEEAYWRRHAAKGLDSPGTLVLYARVDGGVMVADPYRVGRDVTLSFGRATWGNSTTHEFGPIEIWDGLDIERSGKRIRVCEGLLRDWIRWATDPNDPSFERLGRVLEALAPGEGIVPLKKWRRVYVDDARDVPLLQTPYGEVPIVHAAASLKRILGLAYVLVWAWREHLIAAELKKKPPLRSIVLLVDELESHLHPRWQRRIAPALLSLGKALEPDVQVQSIVTTHSPLVLASLEPEFDEDSDRVFNLSLDQGQVSLRPLPWAKQGDVTHWLVSEAFGLSQGRSLEAERAIEAAEAWMRDDTAALPAELATQEAIDEELKRVLGGHDPFWPRWVVWAERQGERA